MGEDGVVTKKEGDTIVNNTGALLLHLQPSDFTLTRLRFGLIAL